MSYRDHYDDTLHDLVDAEAGADYDPLSLDHDYREAAQADLEADREAKRRPPSPLPEEVAEAVREALDASGDLF